MSDGSETPIEDNNTSKTETQAEVKDEEIEKKSSKEVEQTNE